MLPRTCHVLTNVCRMNERVNLGGWNVGGLPHSQASYLWGLQGILSPSLVLCPLLSLPCFLSDLRTPNQDLLSLAQEADSLPLWSGLQDMLSVHPARGWACLCLQELFVNLRLEPRACL